MLKHFIKHLIHNLFLVLIAVVVMWTAIDIVLFIINELVNDQRMGFVTYCTFIVVIAVMSISYTQARSDSKDP